MEPSNGLIGDISATELPEKQEDTEALNELRKKAKYSRSKEFQELKAHMETRIAHYQSFLPGTPTPITLIDEAQRGKYWAIANLVIAELQQVIDGYVNAEEESKRIEEQMK